jgi:hypothetical protein
MRNKRRCGRIAHWLHSRDNESWAALAQSALASLFSLQRYHNPAHSLTKTRRACSFRSNASTWCLSCHKRPHPCAPRITVIAPCSLVCESSSRLPLPHHCHRAMPRCCAKGHRAWPPHISLVAPCPLACEMLSHMPTAHHRHRAMLTGVRKDNLNDASSPTGACSGRRCAPTRSWLF